MRLVRTIIILLAVSIQSSIAQVTYEADQTTSKSKKNQVDKEKKTKKNIDLGFTIGARQCIINSTQSSINIDTIDSEYLMKPKPVFNLSNLYFTTSFKLNEKSKLYVNLGLQRNLVKIIPNQQMLNPNFFFYSNIDESGTTYINSPSGNVNSLGNYEFVLTKIEIALPIIYSYKLSSKINLEFGVNFVNSLNQFSRFHNPFLSGIDDSDNLFASRFRRVLQIRPLGSACFNLKPKSQIRLLIVPVIGSRQDFEVYANGPNLDYQSTISRFTYLNINFTQLF